MGLKKVPVFYKMAGAVGGAVGRQYTPVQLGYVDERITEKYVDEVDFSTSKIGGQPVGLNFFLPLRQSN